MDNFNNSLGVRFGIFSGQNAPETVLHIQDNGKSLDLETWKTEIRAEVEGMSLNLRPDTVDQICDIIEQEMEFTPPMDYERFDYIAADGMHLRLDGDGDMWVFASDWVCGARDCSPCAPGAGSLDEPDITKQSTLCMEPEAMQELVNANEETYYLRNLKTGERAVVSPKN